MGSYVGSGVATASCAVANGAVVVGSYLIFGSNSDPSDKIEVSQEELDWLVCPITQETIKEPAITKYGHMYE